MSAFRESDVLRLLSKAVNAPGVVEGTADQDDCGVLALQAGHELCATTDFVRGTGFTLHRLGHLSFEDLGRYVVAANVSDLAAMGAAPIGYLSVIRYSAERTIEQIGELLKGIENACAEFECPLIGGDSGSYQSDVLSGTALGLVPAGRRLSRRSLRAGDIVFVSGEIGGAAAALAAATHPLGIRCGDAFQEALRRWRLPQPRLALGQAILQAVPEASAMDVSDGLTASLQQLSRITGLGFEIDASLLPIAQHVKTVADSIDGDPVHLACSASVDFELLLGIPEHKASTAQDAAERAGTPIRSIGRCVETPTIKMLGPGGAPYQTLPGAPWDHQTNDVAEMYHAKR